MRRILVLAPILSLLFLSSGCATWVTVSKVKPGGAEKGVRYSLPATFLVVKPDPKGDGTASYEYLYVPIEDQTYAIAAHSIIATHSAEFTLEKGLLTKLVWKPDSTAVANELIKSSAKVAETEIKRQQTARDENKKAKKTAIDAAKGKVATVDAAIRSRTRELQIAELELLSLPGDASPETLRAAKLKVAKAKLALAYAYEDRDSLIESLQNELGADFEDVLNDPGDEPTVFGPVLYRLVDTYDPVTQLGSVRLVAARFPGDKAQLEFARGGPRPVRVVAQPFTLQATATVTASAAKKLTINRTFSVPVESVDSDITIDRIEPHGAALGEVSLENGTALEISLAVPLPPSDDPYLLRVLFVKTDGSFGEASIAIRVRPDPAVPTPVLTSTGRQTVRLAADTEVSVKRQLANPGPTFDAATSLISCEGVAAPFPNSNVGITVDSSTGAIELQLGPDATDGACDIKIGLRYRDATGAHVAGAVVVELSVVR